jgi:AcrR family transcriptional regulator
MREAVVTTQDPGPSDAARLQAPTAGATKERLLDAAERLFSEHGFQGTSMRAVTQAADAAVSAANYHFGSKEELLRAVLKRRVEPVNRRRLERLAELEARSGPPRVDEVLDAFVRPLLEAHAQRIAEMPENDYLRQVAARLFAEPPDQVTSLRNELFAHVNERFLAALTSALPGRPEADVRLALQLAIGVMVHVISGQVEVVAPTPAGDGAPTCEPVLQKMIAFASAGVCAAVGAPARSEDADAPRGGTR